jgi:uncharacterized protein (TIGR00255 family)
VSYIDESCTGDRSFGIIEQGSGDMISSMTGYGEASREADGMVFTVEIRSVNNRYYKSHLRLPDPAAFLEGELEKILRDQVARGTVGYSLHMKNLSGPALFDIDEGVIQAYLRRLEGIGKSSAIPCQIDLAGLLSLPGVVQPIEPQDEWVERMRRMVMELTHEALAELKRRRLDEGRTLAEDMQGNCGVIRKHLSEIGQRKDTVIGEYHDKLQKRANELLSGGPLRLDEELLAREVAIFADRCDISEELTRLEAHIVQFEAQCRNDGSAGRRMDFISQEMLREANTIGSKASDATIGHAVIEIKCAIERIKEQVQNVE